MSKPKIFSRETMHHISAAADNIESLYIRVSALVRYAPRGSDWEKYGRRFLDYLDSGIPRFSILAGDGNKKLSFLAFSSLALMSCPGAGACKNWCYSLKAWRYPAAYFRQLQNYRLMKTARGRRLIAADFEQYRAAAVKHKLETVPFRLYVDGDFSSAADVRFWFGFLAENSWLEAYGYSKSFKQILAAANSAPDNYLLNISSGHKHGLKLTAQISALEFTRGNFIALELGKVFDYSEMTGAEYKSAIRAAAKSLGIDKVFPCPGNCDTCTPRGHACGRKAFKGIPIAVQNHYG